MDPKSNRLFYLSLFLVLVWAAFLLTRLPATQPVTEVPYTTFKQLVADNKVTVVELRGSTATLTLTEPMSADDTGEPTTTARTHIPDLDDDALLPLLEAHDVTVDSRPAQDGWSGWMMALLPWVLLQPIGNLGKCRTDCYALGDGAMLWEAVPKAAQQRYLPVANFTGTVCLVATLPCGIG